MPQISQINEPSTPISDTQAIEESKDLISRAKRNRREQNALHWAFIILLWIIVSGFGLAILVRIGSILLPDQYCWLNEEHLKKLNDFITTGGIGGVGGALLKNKLPSSS